MRALVTGGGGFLGKAIVRMLVERGDAVRSFSRGRYPGLEALGVETVRGDLVDARAVEAACGGMDVVFHVAAKAGVWGDFEAYHRANVAGTRNVVQACRSAGVGRLVFTSSPSVVFDGRDMEGVDESAPYAERFLTPYPQTKAEAEKLVLSANGPRLATAALRPHLVWGPGDPNILPRLIARSRAGRLRRLGGPPKRVDSTFIDNAARAHVLAADRLAPGAAPAGRAYFISNGEPMPVWELIDRLLEAAGEPPVRGEVPPGLAYAAATLLEGAYRALGLRSEPAMTRFVAKEMSTAHWFDLTAARRDLGYEPKVTIAQGLRLLKGSFERAGRVEVTA